jgi:hypothetical protein
MCFSLYVSWKFGLKLKLVVNWSCRCLTGMAASSSRGPHGKAPAKMVKQAGRCYFKCADTDLGMGGLSACVDAGVQLTCGSSMTLTKMGDVTSSVPIRT